jgi:hypothetical protein
VGLELRDDTSHPRHAQRIADESGKEGGDTGFFERCREMIRFFETQCQNLITIVMKVLRPTLKMNLTRVAHEKES